MAPERGRVERAGRPSGVADAGGSETSGVAAGAECRGVALTARLPVSGLRPRYLIVARYRSPSRVRGLARRLGEARRPGSGRGVMSVVA